MGRHSVTNSVISLLILISGCLFSCSDSTPQISSVTAIVIFDFNNATDAPSSRLSLFTETTDVQRVEEIRAVHEESGIEWRIAAPRKIGNLNMRTWAGYTNLVPVTGSAIPMGKYTVTYEDAVERECESSFMVNYPDSFMKSKSTDFPKAFTNGCIENIALYTIDGSLLYYGNKKKNWRFLCQRDRSIVQKQL